MEGGCQEEAQEEKGKEGGVNEIAQEVVEGSKEKVSVHDGIKEAVQRKAGQSFMLSWDCSHIENEVEEESWREGDQLAAQWKRSNNWKEQLKEEG